MIDDAVPDATACIGSGFTANISTAGAIFNQACEAMDRTGQIGGQFARKDTAAQCAIAKPCAAAISSMIFLDKAVPKKAAVARKDTAAILCAAGTNNAVAQRAAEPGIDAVG